MSRKVNPAGRPGGVGGEFAFEGRIARDALDDERDLSALDGDPSQGKVFGLLKRNRDGERDEDATRG